MNPNIKTQIPGDFEIIDDEIFSTGGDKLDFKSIVLEQFRTCGREYIKKDNEKPYMNSVEMLGIALAPYFDKNDEIKKDLEAHTNKIKTIRDKYVSRLNQLQKKQDNNMMMALLVEDAMENKELLPIFNDMLVLLSMLLKEYNYFGESSLTI